MPFLSRRAERGGSGEFKGIRFRSRSSADPRHTFALEENSLVVAFGGKKLSPEFSSKRRIHSERERERERKWGCGECIRRKRGQRKRERKKPSGRSSTRNSETLLSLSLFLGVGGRVYRPVRVGRGLFLRARSPLLSRFYRFEIPLNRTSPYGW